MMSNRTAYIYDDIYLEHELEPLHPESPLRLAALHAVIAESGLLKKLIPVSPLNDENKVREHICAIHTKEHLETVLRCPVTGTVALRAVAGVMAAVDAVCKGDADNAFCALRPPGHHAHNDANRDGICKGEGFCFFNNIAVAARYAQRRWHMPNILIIDWDYHHGNGTEHAFYGDPSVFYFSTHRLPAYPGIGYPLRRGEGKGKGYNLNVPLPSPERPFGRVNDDDLINAFEQHLLPSLDAVKFTPDFVLISAGFDSRTSDPLGDFSITDEGFRRATELTVRLAAEACGGKIVSALEGGYNPEGLAAAGVAHIQALLGE
jgi:acetoin utilization deacetylase AcuC-like enzyme